MVKPWEMSRSDISAEYQKYAAELEPIGHSPGDIMFLEILACAAQRKLMEYQDETLLHEMCINDKSNGWYAVWGEEWDALTKEFGLE